MSRKKRPSLKERRDRANRKIAKQICDKVLGPLKNEKTVRDAYRVCLAMTNGEDSAEIQQMFHHYLDYMETAVFPLCREENSRRDEDASYDAIYIGWVEIRLRAVPGQPVEDNLFPEFHPHFIH